jgi:hypothetical protein
MKKITHVVIAILTTLQFQFSFAKHQSNQADRKEIASAYIFSILKQKQVEGILKVCANSHSYFEAYSSNFLTLWTEKNQKYLSLLSGLRNDLNDIETQNTGSVAQLEKIGQDQADKFISDFSEKLEGVDSDLKLQQCAAIGKLITEGRLNISQDIELKNFLDGRLLILQEPKSTR